MKPYILQVHKDRIKEILTSLHVNRHVLKRWQLREYKREFRRYMEMYPGIDFLEIYVGQKGLIK